MLMVICLMGQEAFADKLVGIGILTTKLAVYSGCPNDDGNPSVTWGGMVLLIARSETTSNDPQAGDCFAPLAMTVFGRQ